jgi:hypothetical protein
MPLSWQKPEIRHNLGEKLSLADPIKNDYDTNSSRKERAKLWQSAHSELREGPCSHGNCSPPGTVSLVGGLIVNSQ